MTPVLQGAGSEVTKSRRLDSKDMLFKHFPEVTSSDRVQSPSHSGLISLQHQVTGGRLADVRPMGIVQKSRVKPIRQRRRRRASCASRCRQLSRPVSLASNGDDVKLGSSPALVDQANEFMVEVDHFHEPFDGHSFIDCVHARSSRIVACTPRRISVDLAR